jgi:hypothetical protein
VRQRGINPAEMAKRDGDERCPPGTEPTMSGQGSRGTAAESVDRPGRLCIEGHPAAVRTSSFAAALLLADDYRVPASAAVATEVECRGTTRRIACDLLQRAVPPAGNPSAAARQNVAIPIRTLTAGGHSRGFDERELIVEARRGIW